MMEYAFYINNQYIMMGTVEEIMEAQKLTLVQLNVVGSLLPLDVPADADMDHILDLTADYTINELAQNRGCGWNTMKAKLEGIVPMTVSDIEFFEDLFYLKEGELLK